MNHLIKPPGYTSMGNIDILEFKNLVEDMYPVDVYYLRDKEHPFSQSSQFESKLFSPRKGSPCLSAEYRVSHRHDAIMLSNSLGSPIP